MNKVGDLIQRVQSLYSKGVESDDSRLTRRHIYHKLLTVGSRLAFQKLNKRQFISRWGYSVLPCVEVIKVDGHECPCVPPYGCKILRTKHKLPKPISSINKHIIYSVTSIDGSVVFEETTVRAKNWRKGDKYTSTRPDFFIHNGYLYITVSSKLKYLQIIMLAGDPVEAAQFPSACEEDCTDCEPCTKVVNPMKVEMYVDDDLLEPLIQFTVDELVTQFNQQREDLSNDSKDNIQQESK